MVEWMTLAIAFSVGLAVGGGAALVWFAAFFDKPPHWLDR